MQGEGAAGDFIFGRPLSLTLSPLREERGSDDHRSMLGRWFDTGPPGRREDDAAAFDVPTKDRHFAIGIAPETSIEGFRAAAPSPLG
jgi:hypothetical protein